MINQRDREKNELMSLGLLEIDDQIKKDLRVRLDRQKTKIMG